MTHDCDYSTTKNYISHYLSPLLTVSKAVPDPKGMVANKSDHYWLLYNSIHLSLPDVVSFHRHRLEVLCGVWTVSKSSRVLELSERSLHAVGIERAVITD
jgi:hypothetical protein